MELEADDLLAQFHRDWPTEYELSRLRWLTQVQATEIARLTAASQPSTYSATTARPFVLEDQEGRHG